MARISQELKTLIGWSSWFSSATTGSHNLTVIAKAEGFNDSAPSDPVGFKILMINPTSSLTGCAIDYNLSDNKFIEGTIPYFKINANAGYTMTGAGIIIYIGDTLATPNVDYTVNTADDGSFCTISFVSGALTASPKFNVTAANKGYTVTKNGNHCTITGADTATRGTDYTFTLAVDAGYTLSSLTAKIGGVSVAYTSSGNTYTIAGNNIIGNLTITAVATMTTQLNTPENVEIDGGVASWNEVVNAQRYTLKADGVELGDKEV